MNDSRLLDCNSQATIEENFKRLLSLIDKARAEINALQPSEDNT